MIEKLANFVVQKRWWVLAVWLVAAIAIVSLSPNISTIQSDNQNSFLPSSYESVKAQNLAKQVSKQSDAPTDIIVFKNKTGTALSAAEQQKVADIVKTVNGQHLAHVSAVATSPMELSKDKTIQLANVIYNGGQQDKAVINSVKAVRNALNEQTGQSGLRAAVTGGESISYDTQASSDRAIKIVGIGTILLVLLLPAFIFRSPLAGLLPVFAVGIVFSIANALIADAGHLFNFHVSQQLSILFTVVLFGIGTDYILFLLFRYRERLRSGDHTRAAVAYALSRAGEAILSAALVVLTSFAALFFAQFGIFSSLAPGLVICVIVMMLAALTLVPALVAIIGEKVFWPSKAWMVAAEKPTYSKRIGALVSRRPAVVSAIVVLALAVLSIFATQYKADFSSFSQPPKGTPSAAAYADLAKAFPAGQSSPTLVYVKSQLVLNAESLRPIENKLASTKGVSAVLPANSVSANNIAVISLILKDDPYSAAAISNVSGPIRQAAHSFDTPVTQVYVGGATGAIADVKAVTDRDLSVLFPIAAAFIFVILAVLLRSLIAPLVLLACVSLGYVATLGATTIIFLDIGANTGLISFIPLFMYIFVVAIGTDYNILTITRLREEIRGGHKPRQASSLTIEHSSATVASAGLILAATFGSLLLGGISFLSQMGSAIAIGVALSAFVIAPFLVPSLAAMLGYAIWWPGHKPVTD
jgi:RND superfamily putative drug exporter